MGWPFRLLFYFCLCFMLRLISVSLHLICLAPFYFDNVAIKCNNCIILLEIIESCVCLCCFYLMCLNQNKFTNSTSSICPYSAKFSFDILMTCKWIHVLVFGCVLTLCFKRLVTLRHDPYEVTLSYVILYLCVLKFCFALRNQLD